MGSDASYEDAHHSRDTPALLCIGQEAARGEPEAKMGQEEPRRRSGPN